MPTSLLAPLLTAGAGVGLSKLFGGSTSPGFTPPTMSAGGLTGSGGGLTASPERQGLVGNIQSTFGDQANYLKNLLPQVAPGVSGLRDAQLGQIENARQASLSNLKDNLARRRVLGSSFGQDAVSRTNAEFGQQKALTAGNSFLQELDLTNQLTTQRFAALRSQSQTALDEMNLEAGISSKMASDTTAQLGANARLEATLNAQQAQGLGKFFGPLANSVGTSAGNFFNSSGGGGSYSGPILGPGY